MGSHWCVSVTNTNLDLRKYYSRGITSALAIAGITFVCLVCMFLDILKGYHSRKPWLPCKFFALNSITLSLVSLAARYPSDRTTLMLSAEDQLCKLSGTVLVCISMGFFMPSLGAQKGPESIRNMASLTILVVVVEFSVIAQMFTGVIFAFIYEHIVVLLVMFVLLLMMWVICLEVTQGKGSFKEHKRVHFESHYELKTTDDMLKHLEWCYVFGYTSSAQFLLGLVTHCSTIGLMCTLCILGLIEATVGSIVLIELKSCERTYKSGWAMQMVLLIQILAIIVGMSAISFRWLTMVRHFKFVRKNDRREDWFYKSVYGNLFSVRWTTGKISGTFHLAEALLTWILIKLSKAFDSITNFVLVLSLGFIHPFRQCKAHGRETDSIREENFRDAVHSRGNEVFMDWILRTAVRDMDGLIEKYQKKPPTNLIKLLLKRPPRNFSLAQGFENFALVEEEEGPRPNAYWSHYRMSCLSLVVLVRLAYSVIPSSSSSPILNLALNDCFDIIYLIDKCRHASNYQDQKRCKLAKDLWMCSNFRCHWFYKRMIEPSIKRQNKQSGEAPLEVALGTIKELMNTSMEEHVRGFDLYIFTKVMTRIRTRFKSIDDISEYVEQLFVDIFIFILKKLPKVIKSYVLESSVEDCGKSARDVMKLVCNVQQLEDRIGCLSVFEDGSDTGEGSSSSDRGRNVSA